jgi:succinyl-diaminopimelate desuccinylase
LIAPRLAHIAGVNIDKGDAHFSPSICVITDIRAGMQVANVTPGELTMMFNVRNTTLTTQKEVRSFIARHLEGLDFDLHLTQNSSPFLTNANSKVVKNIMHSIEKITKIKPQHSTAGGTSDARFFAALGIKVIEFGVINDTVHSINERTTVAEVEGLYKVFVNLIEEWR